MHIQIRSVLLAALVVMATPPAARAQSQPDSSSNDPFRWLEQVSSARAMEWVNAENAKTVSVLQSDPRYAGLYASAQKIAEDRDRIPYPAIIGGQIYNFWQDASHVHGIWRRTTLASYRSTAPVWTTVLDLDALSKSENANWFWKGETCAEPAETRCMVSLSDGGEDAVTSREFDLTSARFVKDGFVVPHGKQTVTWEDANTLLVSREWRPGELTKSGYPFVVKRLRRGQQLTDAVEVFRGAQTDVSAGASTLDDGQGHRVVFVSRSPSFFETERYILTPRGAERLGTPLKSSVVALVAGRLVLSLDTVWAPAGGAGFTAGSLVSVPLASVLANPAKFAPMLIFAPGPRESLAGVSGTHDALVVTQLDNVRGRAYVYTPTATGGWVRNALKLPDNLSIFNIDADIHSNTAFIGVDGFLTPSSVWMVNAQTRSLAPIKSLPPKFDASRDTVEQFEAISADGTRVPYFVVHRHGMKLNGNNPTILYAYGGFQISETPSYSANIGKLWLERGGVWVLANIRGGGEFGPAWHEAGLKTHRQVIY
ncbi:MAG: S9 family peptidase, partial [Gemmatimonadaceae bacterium]